MPSQIANRQPGAPLLPADFKKRLFKRDASRAEKVANHVMLRAKRARDADGNVETRPYEHWNQFAAARHAVNNPIHSVEFARFNTQHQNEYHFIKPKVTYKVREPEKEAGHCKYGTYEEGGRLYCLSNPNHHALPAGQADPIKRRNSLARHHRRAMVAHQAHVPPAQPVNNPANARARARRLSQVERLRQDIANLPLQGGRPRRRGELVLG